MTIEELTNSFMLYKKEKPSNVNELLDYVQLKYIQEKLTFLQYRNLFHELHNRGAVKPNYYFIEDIKSKVL
ncbi:YppF family protein [Alkalihalobacillus sp. BA299]|uniref:YppF family protein n=1 Tax=Alkalihalobacillus sp. BA299 TaxID=2815938 RepID=UPI001ADB56F1|nr:YppF family protein [Alkalihalobacillus sp. BA299]